MTVKEVFSKAFGEVPEGATCHIGHKYAGVVQIEPTLALNESIYRFCEGFGWVRYNFDGEDLKIAAKFVNPDISPRDAHAFAGFFGEAYDRVLEGAE